MCTAIAGWTANGVPNKDDEPTEWVGDKNKNAIVVRAGTTDCPSARTHQTKTGGGGAQRQRRNIDKDQCHCKLYAVFMYAFANEMFIHRVELRMRQQSFGFSPLLAPSFSSPLSVRFLPFDSWKASLLRSFVDD